MTIHDKIILFNGIPDWEDTIRLAMAKLFIHQM